MFLCRTAVYCGSPMLKPYVIQVGEDYTFGRTVGFLCPDGFLLHGATAINCSSSGAWNSSTPSCRPVTCPEPTVPKQSAVVSINSTFGGVVLLVCLPGYVAQPNTISITCLANGSWSGVGAWSCTRKIKLMWGHVTYCDYYSIALHIQCLLWMKCCLLPTLQICNRHSL